MAEFPALPLWTDALIADTYHLTTTQFGAYMLLLIAAWRRPDCSLPDDDKYLAAVARCGAQKWRSLRPVLAKFHHIENGAWTQKRLRKERKYVDVISQKQRANVNSRLNKNKRLPDTTVLPTPYQTDTPTPTPIEDTISTSPYRGEVEIVSSATIAKFPAANVRANGSGNGADHGAASAAREGAGNGSEAEGPALQRQPPAPAQAVAALAIASASGFDPSKP